MMRWFLAALLVVHGLLHFLGFAKSFGYAQLPQLTQPISREMGLVWLAAGLLVIASAVAMVASPRSVWLVGVVALVVSQSVILSAWHDAWAGTAANILLLLVVIYGWCVDGPGSFRAGFDRDVAVGLERTDTRRQGALESRIPSAESRLEPTVTEADLSPLPEPVRRYLRAAGVVGQPRVRNYRLRFRGRIRSAPDAGWMPFEADQQSFADQPTRLFLMRARMFGLPVLVFHRLIGGRATMQVKVAGAIPIADAQGEEMDRSEAVTLFNDMCVLAPGTLVEPGIAWESVDARTARARFTNGEHTISATLLFDDDGLLVNFVSEDRSRASADGASFTRLRFSTPLRDYRNFGSVRLAAHGEARWLLPEGEFTYGEFDLQEISYNVGP
jgi:hypothetical protein